MEKKINLICERKLENYMKITEKAFKLAKESVAEGKEKEAEEILKMASCYLSDAKHFQKQGNYVNAFACINYSHGWLDAGARLEVFKVKDRELFTIS